jgi:type IV secretory pathway VirB10-like protein
LIAWNRIIMPDGRSINIGSMASADLSGAVGVQDKNDGTLTGWPVA